VIRGAARLGDPNSPTGSAVAAHEAMISDRNRNAAGLTIRSQIAEDEASADYLRKAGDYALNQSYLDAGIKIAGAVGKAADLMVDLPTTKQETIPQVQAPQSRVSPSQIASPYLELAATFDAASRETGDAAKRAAHEAGLKAVTRDEDGNVQVARAPIIGDAAIEYRHAIKTAAVADGEEVIKADLLKMRHEFRDDPEGFAKAAQSYGKEKVGQYDKAGGPEVGLALGKIAANTTREIHEGLAQSERDARSAQGDGLHPDADRDHQERARGDCGGRRHVVAGIHAAFAEVRRSLGAACPQSEAGGPAGARRVRDQPLVKSELHVASEGYRIGQVFATQGYEAALGEVDKIRTDPKLNLTPTERFSATTRLMQYLHQQQTSSDVGDRRLANDIDRLGKSAADGYPPTPQQLGPVRAAVDTRNNPELSARLHEVETVAPILTDWRKASPMELERNLAQLDAHLRENGGTPTALRLKKDGEQLLQKMRDGLKNDPIGWGAQSGAFDVQPVQLTGDGAIASMTARVATAEAIADKYGIKPTYLRPNEKIALTEAVKAGGDTMLTAAQNIVGGFDDRAPRVFSEVSKESPVLAHLGALMSTGGSPALLRDAAEAERLKANPEFKHPRGLDKPDTAMLTAQNERKIGVYGGAFTLVPDTERAAVMTAADAFFTRSARTGYDPKLDAQSGSRAAFDQALQEAAGATFGPDKTQYGGIAPYKPGANWFTSNKVLIPGNIRADRFQDVIGKITDADLALMPISPQAADGRAYTAKDIRNATPVAGPGGYRFAIGDPESDDPKWIQGADGKPFTLDLDRMEPALRKRIPDAYASH
jgi:hypothetical protein